MSNVDKIRTSLETLVADARYLKSQMDEISEWNSLGKIKANVSKLRDLVGRIVIFAELATSQIRSGLTDLTSEDKRTAVVGYLDSLLVLPWFLEPFDGPLLGALVEYVVRKLNGALGHDWGLAKVEALVARGRDVLDIAGPLPWEKKGARG